MDTFAALADPVRRQILEILNASPLTAGQLADRFPISRPAVSRHLRVLREAGLVSVAASGREREYRVEPRAMTEIESWLAQFRGVWGSRFYALETEFFRMRRERERTEQAVDRRDGQPMDEQSTHLQEEASA